VGNRDGHFLPKSILVDLTMWELSRYQLSVVAFSSSWVYFYQFVGTMDEYWEIPLDLLQEAAMDSWGRQKYSIQFPLRSSFKLTLFIWWMESSYRTESSCFFWKCDRNPDADVCLHPLSRAEWTPWRFMTACHCYWQWRRMHVMVWEVAYDSRKVMTALISSHFLQTVVEEFLCYLINMLSCGFCGCSASR
jgi:hypothetical protein